MGKKGKSRWVSQIAPKHTAVSDCARSEPYIKCRHSFSKDKKIAELLLIIDKQKHSILFQKLQKEKKQLDISGIQYNDKLVKIYPGLQNAKLFDWLYQFIMVKADSLHYYDQKSSQKRRVTQKVSSRKAFFLVLIKLRLGLTDSDLAYWFSVSQSTTSVILNAWLPFLANQFTSFTCWPSREQNKNAFPKCFQNFPNTIGIIDCTEGAIEKPSLAKAQAQTYSNYKSKNTWKVLICVTPWGTVSFVSKIYEGCAEKINPKGTLMADKRFSISDLLINECSKLVIPPFLKDKVKCSKSSYSCWEGNIQNKRLFYNFTKHNSAFPKGQTWWCFDYLCCISKSSSFTCTFVILLVCKRIIIKFYCKKHVGN